MNCPPTDVVVSRGRASGRPGQPAFLTRLKLLRGHLAVKVTTSMMSTRVWYRIAARRTFSIAEKVAFFRCLWFDPQAEEAANFYVFIFEGAKIRSRR